MLENKRKLFNDGIWVALGLVGNIFVMLIGTRLLTEFLSTDEYGELALALTLVGIVVQVGAVPLSQIISRFYYTWHSKDEKIKFLFNVFLIARTHILAVIMLTVGVVLYFALKDKTNMVFTILLTGLLACLMYINRIAIAIKDILQKRKLRALSQLFFESGRFILAISIIIFLSLPIAESAITGFLAAGLIICIVNFFFLKKLFPEFDMLVLISSRKEMEYNHGYYTYLYPLTVSNLSIWVIMMIDKWLLRNCCNLDVVGGYAAVYQLSYIPMMVIGSFVMILTTPIYYKYIGKINGSEQISEVLRINRLFSLIIFLITLILSFALYFSHDWVASLLLGIDFRSYSWLFPWLLFSGGCFAAAQQLLLKLTFSMNFSSLAAIWVFMAAISAAAYYFGLKVAGIVGLSWSMALISMLLLIISLLISFMGNNKA